MIRWALLALLREQSDYGYRLKTRFERRIGKAWQLNVGQVYQSLHTLARLGLAREVVEAAFPRTPKRRIFEITPKGASALERWLRRPGGRLRPVRDQVILRLMALEPARWPELMPQVAHHLALHRRHLEDVRTRYEASRRASAVAPVSLLALEAELLHAAARLAWLELCCDAVKGASSGRFAEEESGPRPG